VFYNGRKAKDRSVNQITVMMVSSLLTFFFVMLGSKAIIFQPRNDNFDDGAGAVMSQ